MKLGTWHVLGGVAVLLAAGLGAFWLAPAAISGSASNPEAAPAATIEIAAAAAAEDDAPEDDAPENDTAASDPEPGSTDEILDHALDPWLGDLDGMRERGFVRILTAYNPLFFTYDGAEAKGMTIDMAQAFQEHLQEALGTKRGSLNVVVLPVARDDLLPYLVAGKGDIVVANLTITPEREKTVAFSDPTYPDVYEQVVTGPAAPEIASLDDLAASELHVRESSSYFEHVSALNEQRRAAGQAEIPVVKADELLEDYDLLELVNAGLIPAIIVDSHKAALWSQVFDKIQVHEDLFVNSGGQIAWALRPDTPTLMKRVNAFVDETKKGTLLGNILLKRYLGDRKWIDNVRADEAEARYAENIDFIKKYADQYDFDWLMIVAQGFQESKLDQSKVSPAGAVGVMQILPTTAADPNVGIAEIDRAEPNVHAGVKYLRFLKEQYFADPEISPLDQVLFSFAAYNAGPANIAKARKRAAEMSLDANRWFGQTEVAAAKTISREPVIYVRNIYKYYVAYKQISKLRAARQEVLNTSE